MQAIQVFLGPLLWLIPLVIALVNWVKDQAAKNGRALPSWSLAPIAVCVAIVSALVSTYFAVMPDVAKTLVAGAFIGLSASGVFDLVKLLGTIVATPTGQGE